MLTQSKALTLVVPASSNPATASPEKVLFAILVFMNSLSFVFSKLTKICALLYPPAGQPHSYLGHALRAARSPFRPFSRGFEGLEALFGPGHNPAI